MSNQQWQRICAEDALCDNAGVCALIATEQSEQQVAIFKVGKTQQQVYAIGNYDPIGKANVLYRGIVGSVDEQIVVASPLYKQHFSLTSGQCLQATEVSVPVYPARINQGYVELFA
ncbi:nitrite reductase small subunit NirD [Thalassotalea sp. LPB0316]|uniref:nitrite reductase small subunit NirD n=1 Tax=Thalassotalea sp. LPB0316 TaxID=2769490 RepID=UPI0018669A8B|nr:nitrite reductase small subunit NirD [Thalassotalea sp. LPB0316]QOL24871.1 nitrite reductase small subunit NirD [Thalassotalea sp. LPB0316]